MSRIRSRRRCKDIVEEVAKCVRSSDRFAMRVGAKAAQDVVAELDNFSFAPQRFGSRERPLSRFVVFGVAVMEAMALEVDIPTDPNRARWAASIFRRLDSSAWTMIGMLADLSDDCVRFVRRLDERRLDPVQAAIALDDSRAMLRKD